MKNLTRAALAACTLFATMNVQALEYGVAAKVGTLGFGAEMTVAVSSTFAARVGYQGAQLSYDFNGPDNNNNPGDELNYSGDAALSAANLFVDWHPLKTAFRVTTGVLLNFADIETTARCQNILGCEFGNSVFLPAVMGDINAETTFAPVAPYLGLGWGMTPADDSHWSVVADFGVAYIGSPDVEMRSTGTCNSVPTCQAELENEEREIEEALHRLRFYPVINLGVQYRF